MLDELQDTMKDVASFLGNASNVKVAVEKAIKENADLRKQVEDFMEERVRNLSLELINNAKIENGIKICRLQGPRLPEVVKNIAFTIRRSRRSILFFCQCYFEW